MFSDTHADVLLYPHRLKNFAGFSMRLAGLFTQYNIPGEKYTTLKRFFFILHLSFGQLYFISTFLMVYFSPPSEIKLKLFTSLHSLGKDLQQISHLPRWARSDFSFLQIRAQAISQ